MKNCSTCRYWVPTEMEAYKPDAQPHERQSIACATEMLRATHALCSWPSKHMLSFAPFWVDQRIGGGTLTREDDGPNCIAYLAK